MRDPYRPGGDLVGHLRSAIHEESAAIAPQTSAIIEFARMAADEIERLREEVEALRLIYPEGTADKITFLEFDNKQLRAAFEGATVAEKNIALRLAHDEIERLQAALEAPSYRAAVLKELEAENDRLSAAFEQAASIAFDGVEEEGYPGSIDRRPETLRNAILALV
jgi:hypothetical protein